MRSRMTIGFMSVMVLGAGLAMAAPIFEDTFENNIVADSDSETGFWTALTDTGATVSEVDGVLSLEQSGNKKYSGIRSAVDSRFDFLSQELTFSADISQVESHKNARIRFYLTSMSDEITAAGQDMFYFVFYGDNRFYSQVRNNGAISSPTGGAKTLAGSLTRFELTLNSTDFDLTLYLSGGSTTNFSGAHGIVNWDATGAAVTMDAQGWTSPATTAIDNFTVIPERATQRSAPVFSILSEAGPDVSRNLIPNASFEVGTGGWMLADLNSFGVAWGATSEEGAPHGENALFLDFTAAAVYPYPFGRTRVLSSWFEHQETALMFSAMIRSDTERELSLGFTHGEIGQVGKRGASLEKKSKRALNGNGLCCGYRKGETGPAMGISVPEM
jgi:hypothetical protein